MVAHSAMGWGAGCWGQQSMMRLARPAPFAALRATRVAVAPQSVPVTHGFKARPGLHWGRRRWAMHLCRFDGGHSLLLPAALRLVLQPHHPVRRAESKSVKFKRSGAIGRILCCFKSETLAPLQQPVSTGANGIESERLNFDGVGRTLHIRPGPNKMLMLRPKSDCM